MVAACAYCIFKLFTKCLVDFLGEFVIMQIHSTHRRHQVRTSVWWYITPKFVDLFRVL